MNALPTKVKLVAAFDFGSNATKCSLARIEEGRITYLADHRLPNRLAAFMDDSGKLQETAMEQGVSITKELMQVCEEFGSPAYIAVGTEALRKAVNGDEFCSRIREQCGISVQIISGKEEAELTWLGATSVINELSGNILLFDSGGASTELIIGSGNRIDYVASIPLGAVSLNKDFNLSHPPTNEQYCRLARFLEQTIKLPHSKELTVVGCGGGISTLAKVAQAYSSDLAETMNGYYLSRHELERQLSLYCLSSIARIIDIPGMEKERADIIMPACLLVLSIIRIAGVSGIYISTGGIRHGLIIRESRR